MSASTGSKSCPRNSWIERFIESVRGFNPALDAEVARGLAETEFVESGHLEPEEAAEAFASRDGATAGPSNAQGDEGM